MLESNDSIHDRKYGCHIRIGTSGYSYAEWIDAGFYPPDTKPGEMLRCYTQMFSVTELNYTWYQIPKSQAVERMLQRVSPDFKFAVKLTRYLTHEIDEDAWRGYVNQYRDGIAPLVQSEQLDFNGAVWITSRRSFDGLGRVLESTQILDSADVDTTYSYDDHGRIQEIEMPDPSDDGRRRSRAAASRREGRA